MAVATGGTVFGDEAIELKLEDVTESNLGEAAEIIITKDDTLVMKGKPLLIIDIVVIKSIKVTLNIHAWLLLEKTMILMSIIFWSH